MSVTGGDRQQRLERTKAVLLAAVLWMTSLWIPLTGLQVLGPVTSQKLYVGGQTICIALGLLFGIGWQIRSMRKGQKTAFIAFFGVAFALFGFAFVGLNILDLEKNGLAHPLLDAAAGLAPWIFFLACIDFYQCMRTNEPASTLLDGAVAAAGMALPAWHFVVARTWMSPGEWSFAKAMVAIQPLGYTACLFAGVSCIALLHRNGRVRRGPSFATVGLILFALGGSFQSYNAALSKNTGVFAYHGLIIALGISFFIAASIEGLFGDEAQWRTELSDEHSSEPFALSIARVTVPNVLSLGAFALTAIYEIKSRGSVPPIVVVVGSILMLVAMARQAYGLLRGQTMLRDNELLTDKLRQVTGGLEDTIAQRTRQLNALHQLTKAVSNTLDPKEVLSMAAVHGRTALKADAVVIWLAEGDKHHEPVMKGALQLGLAERQEISQQLYIVPAIESVQCLPIPMEPNSPSGPVAALLQAPMIGQQKLVGIIGVMRFKGAFNKTEWEMIEAIGLEAGTALKHAQQYAQARAAADQDPVTGLLNHRAIHQVLDEAMEAAAASQQPCTVMMMDMNNFKMFNDTYGHPAGDEALRRVAKALAEACQAGATVGRYGGDEFLAVLPGANQQTALSLAQQVKAKLLRQGFVPNPTDGRVIPITLSFGIASFPKDSQSRHELIATADANLYTAKRSEEGIRVTSDIQRESSQLRNENSFAVLDGMVTAVDNKDSYTRRHSEDVAEFSLWIADELGLSPDTLRTIRIGALLHDVGKITVPDEILRKPGRLTPEEFEILKRHPRLGALIVAGVPGMESIIDIVQHHHERWDGKGYPDELRGEEIPMLGRLVAVADTFSAMTTDRPYRKGLSWEVAVKEIADNAGTQFDPAMAEAFLKAAQKKKHRQKTAA